MSQYLESDASGASNLPPDQSAYPQARPERVRHTIYGSLAAIDRTIKILHALGYTDPNDWSDPIPLPPTREVQGTTTGTASPPITPPGSRDAEASKAHTWVVITTKTVLIE